MAVLRRGYGERRRRKLIVLRARAPRHLPCGRTPLLLPVASPCCAGVRTNEGLKLQLVMTRGDESASSRRKFDFLSLVLSTMISQREARIVAIPVAWIKKSLLRINHILASWGWSPAIAARMSPTAVYGNKTQAVALHLRPVPGVTCPAIVEWFGR